MSVRLIGVSLALEAPTYNALSAVDRQAFQMEAFTKLEAELRSYTGDLRPTAYPTFSGDGPHDDPLQGPIYVFTCSAHYETDDLPPDCRAYATHHVQRQEGTA